MLFIRFFRRAFRQFFFANDTVSNQNPASSSSTYYISEFHRFGWLLFLALRVHAFSRFKDLVTCTNGLVSILVSLSLFSVYFVAILYYNLLLLKLTFDIIILL